MRARFKLVAKIGIVMTSSPDNPRGVHHYDLSVEHLQRAFGHGEVAIGPLQQPVEESLEVFARFLREADAEGHGRRPRFLASASCVPRPASTSSASK